MTKYVACFFVIISLLGQSLLLSANAEPILGSSTEISTMTQKLSTHLSVSQSKVAKQNNLATEPQDMINSANINSIHADNAVAKHIVKTSDLSKCKTDMSKCVQVDSGHCSAHSYCHSGALLPVTMAIVYLPFTHKIMTTAWSSKTTTGFQDIRPPIA